VICSWRAELAKPIADGAGCLCRACAKHTASPYALLARDTSSLIEAAIGNSLEGANKRHGRSQGEIKRSRFALTLHSWPDSKRWPPAPWMPGDRRDNFSLAPQGLRNEREQEFWPIPSSSSQQRWPWYRYPEALLPRDRAGRDPSCSPRPPDTAAAIAAPRAILSDLNPRQVAEGGDSCRRGGRNLRRSMGVGCSNRGSRASLAST